MNNEKKNDTGFLVIILLVGVFLVFFRIGRQSLWLDEALTLNIARNSNHMWYILTHSEPYMWTYVLPLHFWMKFGTSESFLRGLSALFAVGTIPFIYLLGRKLFNSSTGIIAAFLLSINTFYVRYAQEIRGYSLFLLLSTITSYVFILMLEKPSLARRIGYIVIAALSVYTHQFSIFVIISHFTFLLFTKKFVSVLKLALPLLIGLLLLFVPLFFIRVPLLGNASWINTPAVSDIYELLVSLAGGTQTLLLIESFAVVSGFILILRNGGGTLLSQKRHYLFTACLLIIPIGLIVLTSFTYKSIFVPRYLIASIIPLILLTSYGVASMNRMAKLLIVTLLLICSAVALLQWYGFYPSGNTANSIVQPKEDWRGATNYVLSHASPHDGILFYPYYLRTPFSYYADQYTKTHITQPLPSILELASQQYIVDQVLPEPNESLIKTLADRDANVWLVLSHNTSVRLKRKQQTEEIEGILQKYYRPGVNISFTNIKITEYVRL